MENDYLKIRISSKGAELSSIMDQQSGFEFLWPADPAVWGRHAPVLFPVVGKLKNNELHINGTSYPMNQHGFARDEQFDKLSETTTETWYQLKSNELLKKKYPYDFILKLGYVLQENRLICKYEAINNGNTDLLFSIGAHPGFNLPTKKLADYTIEFEQPETAERYLLDDGLFNSFTRAVFTSPNEIGLSTTLFEEDAIVLKDLRSRKLTLKQNNGSFAIDLHYPGFPYLGIWTKKNCEDFICLEPWCGHADPAGGHADMTLKEGIISLHPGEIFRREYGLTFYK